MDYLKGNEPEKYRYFINEILSKLHDAYPTGEIDSISKTKYCLSALVAFRLGYPDVVSMLDAYGFRIIKIPRKKLVRIDNWTDEDKDGIVIPTILPPDKDKPKEVFAYKINPLYGFKIDPRYPVESYYDSLGEIDEKVLHCAKEKYLNLLQEINNVIAGTPEIHQNGIGYCIQVNRAWFNEHTDILLLKKVAESEGITLPADFYYQKKITRGYKTEYFWDPIVVEKRRKKMKQYMALAALFLYPGCDVIVEVTGHSDISFASPSWWEQYKKDHPGKYFLIVNSKTGVSIKHFDDRYKCTAGKDEEGSAYEKMIKKPCPDNYIELWLEGRTRFIRIPKEIKDGKVCVDGVPLDLYECVRFDPEMNAYVISNLKKYDIDLEKATFDGISFVMKEDVFDWARGILPVSDASDLRFGKSFPSIPKVDELHRFLNKLEPIHSKIAMEDLENAAYIYKNISLRLTTPLMLRTTKGDKINLSYRYWEGSDIPCELVPVAED